MTSEEKDRFICEKLGVCWHENAIKGISGTSFDTRYYVCKKCNAINTQPPDLTSEAGRVQLLKLMDENGLEEFLTDTGAGFVIRDEKELTYSLDVFYLIDDTGKFRDAVFRWMAGEV